MTDVVTCPECGESVHWLPGLNRTVAVVGCHGPDDTTDCSGSFARVTRPALAGSGPSQPTPTEEQQ